MYSFPHRRAQALFQGMQKAALCGYTGGAMGGGGN